MKLFAKRGSDPLFGEFDTRLKSRRIQQNVLKANLHPKRTEFEALIGKRRGPQLMADITAKQSFADFKLMNETVRESGLARFFKRAKVYSKGDKQ